ncbi:hypothetical protein [Clostridioides difficile]|uniref:hypothetical protein n=1 Tax=Clostridioides difficile TaxID=1496 RepID=UPI0021C59ADB|nr:hypothetical protein [Clostridioides difficile]UUV16662.1 hypothetical protein NQ183_20265 [Clostridioides difficile]
MSGNIKQIFKSGRETKVFAVEDDLSVNDFYNEIGILKAVLHSKVSRITMIINDSKNNSNTKLKFCFDVDEWKEFSDLLKDGPESFENNFVNTKSKYKKTKINKYTNFENGYKEIRNFSLSCNKDNQKKGKYYWIISISIGKGKLKDPKNSYKGIIKETYSELKKNYFVLQTEEINEMIEAVNKYIPLWENSMFPVFLENRKTFSKRLVENNSDYETISKWNNLPKGESVKNNINDVKNSDFCSVCNAHVDERTKNISNIKYGNTLCYKCSNELNKTEGEQK